MSLPFQCSILFVHYLYGSYNCSIDSFNSYNIYLNFDNSTQISLIIQVFSQIWETTPTNLKIGLELLQAVKELELHPTRASLDFLLSTCVKAKDSQIAWFIWSEYETAELEYNVLTFVR